LALTPTFTTQKMIVGGVTKGLIGFDSASNVAFLAYKTTPPGANPTADEASVRTQIAAVGALNNNTTTQTFSTWDNLPALQAFYENTAAGGSGDLKARANALANALVGSGAGVLTGTATNGPFKLQAEYVHRSAQTMIVIIALTPLANFVEPAIFRMSDTAGGSGLAQFGDANGVQCETFTPGNAKVDFLFVVDDSGSMAASQNSLAQAATAMTNKLNNSSLDYRIALVTTSYVNNATASGPNKGVVRGFVNSTGIATFQSWLTSNAACTNTGTQCGAGQACYGTAGGWVGVCGSGTEQLLSSAAEAVSNLSAAAAAVKFRPDATVAVVLLGDADDQSSITGITAANLGASYSTYFNTPGNTLNGWTNNVTTKIPVHGIICPAGTNCNNETQQNPQRHAEVITATGGVRGAINDTASITTAINAIVDSAIAAGGYKTLKPPIGASIKVSMASVATPASCNAADIPRSRVNGFDFDGINRSISFFGACKPGGASTNAAVSYRYWIDTTPNPNGNPPPCSSDPYYDSTDPDLCLGHRSCNKVTSQCECPADCGGNGPTGKSCNSNIAVCDFVCLPDCNGACSGYQTCNTTSCACQCVQNATCAAGFTFQNSGGVCGCVCDTAALNCGATYNADPNSCSCVCKSDCGGCGPNSTCNTSTCTCGAPIQ
ncbi:MAG: adventurous gliding motility lipoprotein CglD, partial [Myxococcaceae bacterium]